MNEDAFWNKLHELAGYCEHCGKKTCSGKASNSFLPYKIKFEHIDEAVKAAKEKENNG